MSVKLFVAQRVNTLELCCIDSIFVVLIPYSPVFSTVLGAVPFTVI